MTDFSTTSVGDASKARSKITNDPVRGLGQSAEARRVRDLYRSYLVQLGNPADVATQAMIIATAQQVVIAENARRDHLAGKADLDSVIRAENMSARALRRLGLNKPAAAPREDFAAEMLRLATPQAAGEARTAEGAEVAADSDQRTGGAGSQAGGGTE